MKIQQINNYQNYKKMPKGSQNFRANSEINNMTNMIVITNHVSFTAKNAHGFSEYFEGAKKIVGAVEGAAERIAETAGEVITKTKNEIIERFETNKKTVENLEGSYEDITKNAQEQREEIDQKYWMTKKRKDKVNESENYAKRIELLNRQGALDVLESTVKTNELKAAKLSEELARFNKENAIKRHEFIKRQQNADYVGFDRIAGYQDVKDNFQKFFFKAVDDERAGKIAKLPNGVFFFGPTGTGKTTSTIAIAEETGCHFVQMETGRPNSEASATQFIKDLYAKAERAEAYFQNGERDPKNPTGKLLKEPGVRTILFIDELTKVISKNSKILKDFADFAEICSEKYHCTIFGSTNEPSDVGIKLVGSKIFPIKISFGPPDKDDAKAIFQMYTKGQTSGDVDFDKIVDCLFETGKQRGGIYSNTQIRKIVELSHRQNKVGLHQSDIIDTIASFMKNENAPAIKFEKKKIFDEEVKKFASNV